jgi:hypothetical protein
MITLYLDMDGVIANFDKAYKSLRTYAPDGKRFRSAVMDYQIFEDLEMMPNAMVLLRHVSLLSGVHIEMLTSLGTFESAQGAEAKRQKLLWLKKHNITYKANFVRSKGEKAKYATSTSILIDDSEGCITPFEQATGQAILYEDSKVREALASLDNIILQLRALDAVRMVTYEYLLSKQES